MAHDWKPRGYLLEQVLGSGASADVWRARVTATGAPVALKRIAVAGREQARRAREEAALLMALEHPNLVRLHALTRAGDSLVLVLDLAEKGSLRDLLHARGRLTPGETITALAPIAAAVSYLHSRSIVHGDVSAGNILFTESGTPLLGDVGVARITGDERDAESTPIYVDPAVAGGAVPSPSSDVFMLAAVAFHLLTGRPLWSGGSALAILARAVGGVPTDVADRLARSGVPSAMTAVVVRALDARPRARGSAVEFALDLRHSAPPLAVEFRAGRPVPDPVAVDRPPVGRHRAGEPGRGNGAGDVSAEPGTYPSVPRHTRTAADRPVAGRPDAVVRPDIPRRATRGSPSRAVAVAGGTVLLVVGVVLVLASLTGRDHGSSAHRPPTRPPVGGPPDRPPTITPRTPPITTPRPPPTSVSVPDSTTRWMQVLVGLDVIRAQAYAVRRPDLLARVYAPGALLSGDIDQLQRIVPRGCGLTGALTAYRSADVTPAARSRTVVTVVAALPRTRLVCAGAVSGTAPAVPPRRMRIELVDTAHGPRILDERPT